LHHLEGHDTGWITFEAKYRLNLRRLAQELAAVSPHLRPARDRRRGAGRADADGWS
jgi:hypothetical protein